MSPVRAAYEQATQLNSVEEQVRALIRTSWDMRRSYPKDALELSMKARELSVLHRFNEGIAYSYRNSGTAYYLLSQYNQALIDLEKALRLLEALNDTHAIATTLRNIGNVYHSMQLPELAIDCYEKALVITQAEDDKQGTAYNLGNIGHVQQKMQRYDDAKEYLLKAKALLETIDDELGLADLLNNLGNVCISTGETETGLEYIRSAITISTAIGHLRGMGEAHKSLGNFHLTAGNNADAIAAFRTGLDAAEEMGEGVLVIGLLRLLSETYEREGNDKEALAYYKRFATHQAGQQQHDQLVQAETLRLKAAMDKATLEKQGLQAQNAELENVRKELENLSIVARQTENSILILDADGTLEWVNASFEKLNGLTLAAFKKKYGNTIYEVSNNPGIRSIIADCVRNRATVRYEAPNYLDDGKVVWESSTLTPIFRDSGELLKLIIIDTDVTERKLAEELVHQKNKDITDSIRYARYLQEAILPSPRDLQTIFDDSFIFFRPKDIVSGDFSWFSQAKGVRLVAAADCTGHGVPGAMMSVLGNEMLNVTVRDPKVHSPATTLDLLDQKVREVFANKHTSDVQLQDGMDIGLLVWHYEENYVQYAGAKRPLVIVRDGEVKEIAGDRFSIGGRADRETKRFTEQLVDVRKGDMLYLFSDGYPDQFGGKNGKKFMYRNFIRLLTKIAALPVDKQEKELARVFDAWKGDLGQVDDVIVVGVRIT